MRVIAAGLFVLAGIFGIAMAAMHMFPRMPPWLVGVSAVAGVPVLVILAYALFGTRLRPPLENQEEHLRRLEGEGLLESTTYRVTRAFGVEESEDEGMHYFLELADGRVLFLSGQYLYDYAPPSFPCTEITLRRHRTEGYVADVLCGGTPLALEGMAPPFGDAVFEADAMPQDGDVTADATFEELKRRHRAGA